MNKSKVFLGFSHIDLVTNTLFRNSRLDLKIYESSSTKPSDGLFNSVNSQRYDCIILDTLYSGFPYTPQQMIPKIKGQGRKSRHKNRDTPIIFTGLTKNYRLQGVPRDVFYVPFELGEVRGQGNMSDLESKIKEVCRIR